MNSTKAIAKSPKICYCAVENTLFSCNRDLLNTGEKIEIRYTL